MRCLDIFFQEHARELLVVSLPNTKGMFEFPPLHNSTPGADGTTVQNHGVGKEVLHLRFHGAGGLPNNP